MSRKKNFNYCRFLVGQHVHGLSDQCRHAADRQQRGDTVRVNLGFTGPNGGACAASVAGKYKDATGSADCTLCEDNKYQPMSTQTSVSICLVCPFASIIGTTGRVWSWKS